MAAAESAIRFFGYCRHSKGKWAGKPITLDPWQCFVIGSLFGWKRGDGRRRFRVAHVEVARKNGKTTLAAGVGLALLLVDREPGAEIYTCATKKEQAKLAHSDAKAMVKGSQLLANRVRIWRDALTVEDANSRYIPLGADADTLDGLNVHGAICDELHAWKDRKLWDVIETATGARDQPLILAITTAGSGRDNIWWERRQAAINAVNGTAPNDAIFGAIYTLDDSDDWTDERTWIKANPSLGVTVRLDDLRDAAKEAIDVPAKQNAFKRLRLNVPTQQYDLWLDLAKWDACPNELPDLAGRVCYIGVDLSATRDMTAVAWVFPPLEDFEPWAVKVGFFLPAANLLDRCRRDHAPYDLWERQGWLTLTDGDTVDHGAVQKHILEEYQNYAVQKIAFDRAMAAPIVTTLREQHGLDVVGYSQSIMSMTGPTKEFEMLVESGRLNHGGNPILRYNASNAAVYIDGNENKRPHKAHSSGRIDGVVACIIALGVAVGEAQSSVPTIEVF